MKEYSIAEARNGLPAIVHEVEQGQPISLTRRGRPVAVIVSSEEYERLIGDRPGFTELLRQWRATVNFEESGITGDEFENVRDRSINGGRDFSW